jgi:hypothetical protein
MNTSEMIEIVRGAWSTVPAPPEDDMKFMEWGWGEDTALAFTGVAPMDVNIGSAGFFAATPLFDLPPRAAAAYLGTFLLSLLKELEIQERVGIFDDVVTRAHTLTVLTDREFWDDVIRKHLPPKCQEAVEQVAHHLVASRDAFALDQEQVDTLRELATQSNK